MCSNECVLFLLSLTADDAEADDEAEEDADEDAEEDADEDVDAEADCGCVCFDWRSKRHCMRVRARSVFSTP
jgi:hypothetical protein